MHVKALDRHCHTETHAALLKVTIKQGVCKGKEVDRTQPAVLSRHAIDVTVRTQPQLMRNGKVGSLPTVK